MIFSDIFLESVRVFREAFLLLKSKLILLTFSDNCRPKLPEEMINVVEMDGNCYFCGQMI